MSDLKQHALKYAAQGYEVFPVKADKTPYTPKGMNDATSDVIQVEQWWNRWPDALIGHRVAEDQIILDIDPRHGGDKVWNELTAQYGDLGITKMHHSGRNDGGFHAWAINPGGKLSIQGLVAWAMENEVATLITTKGGKQKWTCGIDILRHGHRYSILPPSPHALTGLPYAWDLEGAPSPLHGKLAQLLTPPPPPPTPPRPQRSALDVGDSIADWYSNQAQWCDILNGWTIFRGDGEQDGSKWRHPNASGPWSATIRHGCLFSYSPNVVFEETEPGSPKGYTKFRAYAELHHQGNMTEAARAARQMRDGDTMPAPPPPRTALADDEDDIDDQDDEVAPSRDQTSADPDEKAYVWPEAVPLQGQRECPPFPIDALPDWIADQCRQVADEMQYGPDLPAQLALTALALALSKGISVAVNGPWVEDANIYTVTGMNASAGKSPAVKYMVGPLVKYERDLAERAAAEVDSREIERKMLERELAEAIRKDEPAQANVAADKLREKPPIVRPRLIAEDVTPEKLAILLSEQGERMALISTEGGLFQLMAGRYSDSSNLDVFLQSWSGDNFTQDRVGRDSLRLESPRLTIGLTVQPHVISKLGENDEFNGRGLVARFMFSMPPSTVGRRDKKRRSTWDRRVADHYADMLVDIARRYHPKGGMPRELALSVDALDVFQEWQQEHEDKMAYNGPLEHLAEWVSKMESTVCRVAGALHVAEDIDDDLIGPDIIRRAIAIGDYWEAHAKIAGDLWGADPEVAKASRILAWAERRRDTDGDDFTIRDVQRGLRTSFPKAIDTVQPLRILTESGWLRWNGDGPIEPARPGRPADTFTLRPPPTTQSDDLSHLSHLSLKDESRSSSSSFSTEMGSVEPRDMCDRCDRLPSEPDAPVDTTDPSDDIAAKIRSGELAPF